MLRFLLLVAGLVALPTVAHSAPPADVVMVWAPGVPIAPIEAAAQRRGAAVIDRSPAAPASVETAQFLQRGIAAYGAIQLDQAQAALDQARDLADRTGGQGLTRVQLSDLFLYRGLVRAALGDETTAWDELVTALVIHPTRSLDPTLFAPKVQALIKRVRDEVLLKRPQAKLEIDAPDGCAIQIDGEAVAGPVLRAIGLHYARVTCSDREPWSSRMDLTTLDVRVTASPKPYRPPSDAELLVQVRSAGMQAVVAVEVQGQLALVRKIGLDGRERARRAIAVPRGDLRPVAGVVEDWLTPHAVTQAPWYQSRWAWAIGAAVATAAIVVPVTAAIAGDRGAASWTVRVRSLP